MVPQPEMFQEKLALYRLRKKMNFSAVGEKMWNNHRMNGTEISEC
jgi:hypothetical protein